MSVAHEDFDKYICFLAHNIWRFPFWVEERAKEKADRDSQDRHADSGNS